MGPGTWWGSIDCGISSIRQVLVGDPLPVHDGVPLWTWRQQIRLRHFVVYEAIPASRRRGWMTMVADGAQIDM
jgi:hypothetical protein